MSFPIPNNIYDLVDDSFISDKLQEFIEDAEDMELDVSSAIYCLMTECAAHLCDEQRAFDSKE